ncbi:MAG: zinc-binding alcohol dehydrogenase, partial [Actinomycetota bacterium]
TFDCAGTRASLDSALRATKARGRVVLSAMPARADLSPAWYRELEVVGAYAGAGAFADSMAFLADADLGGLVSASYPLSRWREALDHALTAGRLGSVKIAFDPTKE